MGGCVRRSLWGEWDVSRVRCVGEGRGLYVGVCGGVCEERAA